MKSEHLILPLYPLYSPPRTAYGELERDRWREQGRREEGSAGSEDSGLPKGQCYLALTSSQQQGVTEREASLQGIEKANRLVIRPSQSQVLTLLEELHFHIRNMHSFQLRSLLLLL